MAMAKSAKSTAMPLFTVIATVTVIATWAMVVAIHAK
jgi:hypothetical protein